MKNHVACLITFALFSTGLVMADGGNGNNNKGQKKGPPNKANQGGNNRKGARQPLNLSGQNQKGGQGQNQKGGQGQNQKGGQGQKTGMQKKRPPLSEVLELTGEKAKKIDALGKGHHERIETIHENKNLTPEQKLIAIRAAHQKFDAKLKELLDDDEMTKLHAIRIKNANPENGQNPGGMDPLRIKVLKLTKEQVQKLTAARQFADKKILGILNNKELSETDRKKKIHAVHKQHQTRVEEILTDEQLALMKKINKAATQMAGKGGNNQNPGNPGASGGE